MAISQLSTYISGTEAFSKQLDGYLPRWEALAESHRRRLAAISTMAIPTRDNTFGSSFVASTVRRLAIINTIWVIEAVTNATLVADQIQATLPGSWINCGGGGLGWSGGGALGTKLATEVVNEGNGKFVCCIVGDGTYLFSVLESVHWIS
jgi:thiamine pyrophosphate-dependent acetolactate synthase large subunit-like protein